MYENDIYVLFLCLGNFLTGIIIAFQLYTIHEKEEYTLRDLAFSNAFINFGFFYVAYTVATTSPEFAVRDILFVIWSGIFGMLLGHRVYQRFFASKDE